MKAKTEILHQIVMDVDKKFENRQDALVRDMAKELHKQMDANNIPVVKRYKNQWLFRTLDTKWCLSWFDYADSQE